MRKLKLKVIRPLKKVSMERRAESHSERGFLAQLFQPYLYTQ